MVHRHFPFPAFVKLILLFGDVKQFGDFGLRFLFLLSGNSEILVHWRNLPFWDTMLFKDTLDKHPNE